MITKEIDIQKTNSIKLPQSWKKGKAYISEEKDVLIIKKYSVPDFTYVREKMRQLKNKISDEDIEKAIDAARC